MNGFTEMPQRSHGINSGNVVNDIQIFSDLKPERKFHASKSKDLTQLIK